MSHVATIDIEIKDLGVLREACKRIGLEFVEGQETYRWFGNHVGDYPLPEGFTAQDLGRCNHAIRVKDKPNAYEIGVCKARGERPGYVLLWDFWAGGRGLEEAVGKDCCQLKQAYAIEAARMEALQSGYQVSEQLQSDGSMKLVLSK